MFLLPLDVPDRNLPLRNSNGESSIALLPCETFHFRKTLMDPLRGRRLQYLNRLGHRNGTGQRNQYMDMIRSTTHCQSWHSMFAGYSANIAMQPLPEFIADTRPPPCRCKHHVYETTHLTVRHDHSFRCSKCTNKPRRWPHAGTHRSPSSTNSVCAIKRNFRNNRSQFRQGRPKITWDEILGPFKNKTIHCRRPVGTCS